MSTTLDHIGPADAGTALAHAERRASEARRAAEAHREAIERRAVAIRHAAAVGAGTRAIARGCGLDPAHVHRIIHAIPPHAADAGTGVATDS